MESPLRFTPFLRPMVWGGRRLGTVLAKPLAGDGPYGESWEVSDHPLHRSVVTAGPYAGRTLRLLMQEQRAALLGPAADRHESFPWLIKFLDANDWLSVQVHPDERAVRKLWPGEGSKTEAWFVLDAASESRIYAGLLPGTDERKLREAVAAGKVAECLHALEPRAGDCVFLPAGTVHAVGGGVLIAEVQQTSDATFRLFDWDRRDARGNPRELHVDKAMASIHWDQGPVKPVHVPAFRDEPAQSHSVLVRCPYFVLEYVQESAPFALGGEGRLQAALVLRGRGRLATAVGEEELAEGQTWVLPASMPAAPCYPDPNLGLLVSTLPG